MRHGDKVNNLGRKKAHREAMLSNMACSLILSKRIKTTLAKAKALRVFVEPLITKSKNDTTHSRRTVFSHLGSNKLSKEAIKELFGSVSSKVANRPGGYTRIIKLDNRLGDNAEICYMELVDFNEVYVKSGAATTDTKKKRSRRSSGAAAATKKAVEPTKENTEDNASTDAADNTEA
ncbi:MAG: 50S ribosomal protein L17 [Bacteroidota bacterium]